MPAVLASKFFGFFLGASDVLHRKPVSAREIEEKDEELKRVNKRVKHEVVCLANALSKHKATKIEYLQSVEALNSLMKAAESVLSSHHFRPSVRPEDVAQRLTSLSGMFSFFYFMFF